MDSEQLRLALGLDLERPPRHPAVKPMVHATEREMLDRLNLRYAVTAGNGASQTPRYVRAEHVRSHAGFAIDGMNFRTCDYIAVDAWQGYGPTRGSKLHGHEVKVSRSDWLTELRDPDKSAAFRRYLHYWWLVVPDQRIVRLEELPKDWGLLVSYHSSLKVVVHATRVEPDPMPLTLTTALLRSVVKTSIRLATGGPTYPELIP